MSGKKRMNTRSVALGAMLTALGVLFIYIGAITDVLDISLCAVASLILVFSLIEFGRGYAYMVFFATAILSSLLLPNKFAAMMYIFCGFYSIVKSSIEKNVTFISWILKILYINAVIAVSLLAAKYIFMLPDDGLWATVGLIVLGNIAFILFDIAVTRLITAYLAVLRHKYGIDKYLKRLKGK